MCLRGESLFELLACLWTWEDFFMTLMKAYGKELAFWLVLLRTPVHHVSPIDFYHPAKYESHYGSLPKGFVTL